MYSLPTFPDNTVGVNRQSSSSRVVSSLPIQGSNLAAQTYNNSSNTNNTANNQSGSGQGLNFAGSTSPMPMSIAASGYGYGAASMSSVPPSSSGSNVPPGARYAGAAKGFPQPQHQHHHQHSSQPPPPSSQYQSMTHPPYTHSFQGSANAHRGVFSAGHPAPVSAPQTYTASAPTQPQIFIPATGMAGYGAPSSIQATGLATGQDGQVAVNRMLPQQAQHQQQQQQQVHQQQQQQHQQHQQQQQQHQQQSQLQSPSRQHSQQTPSQAPSQQPVFLYSAPLYTNPSGATRTPVPLSLGRPAAANGASTSTAGPTTTPSAAVSIPGSGSGGSGGGAQTSNPMLMVGPPYMTSLAASPYTPPMMMMDVRRAPSAGAGGGGVVLSGGHVPAGALAGSVGAMGGAGAGPMTAELHTAPARGGSLGHVERQQVELQQTLIREQILALPVHQPFAYQPPPMQKNKGNAVLFVGQLNYDVTEVDIQQMFSFYGVVQNVVLFKDNRKSRRGGANSNNNNNNGGYGNQREGNEFAKTAEEEKQVVGSSAFVTYASTQEADHAIMSLHGRYCMDSRDKPVQVSYCQKTDVISEYGYRHALKLHAENLANPVPSLPPVSPSAGAMAQRLNEEMKESSEPKRALPP